LRLNQVRSQLLESCNRGALLLDNRFLLKNKCFPHILSQRVENLVHIRI
jgi:hypothetical protein